MFEEYIRIATPSPPICTQPPPQRQRQLYHLPRRIVGRPFWPPPFIFHIPCHLFLLSRYLCGDMITTQAMPTTADTDTQLVEWSLTGDRDAFRQIVERYKSLVCSITCNATGSLSLSEDLAQETFVAAWKQLPELRDPSLLRSWLCGITRFLVGKEFRRQGREPIHAADSLEGIQDPPSPEPSPAAQAVTHEEEAILWRALERIP